MTDAETTRLGRWLGRILGWGAASSAILLAAGLVLELTGTPARLASGLANAGLLILLATPLVRVAASVVEYLLARDWLFAALTGAVLATLLGSVLVAIE